MAATPSKQFCSLLTLCLTTSLCFGQAQQPPAAQQPTCALVVDLAKHESLLPLVSLLEIELAKQQTVTLLDRVDVNEVLREQELNLMFAPEGGPDRVATGNIIRANLLVLLRPAKTIDKTSALQIVISESRRGLRLFAQTMRMTDEVEADVQLLVELIDQAAARSLQPITDILAVPPFVDRNLTYDYEQLKAVYARLVEQVLGNDPNVLLVELEEAQAIIHELALVGNGDRLRRNLPLIVLGEYRHGSDKDQPTVSLKIEIQRGGKQLDQIEAAAISEDAVAAFISDQATAMFGKIVGRQAETVDLEADAAQLAARAQLHAQLGQFREALSLARASLLVKPDQLIVHLRALELIYYLVPLDFGNPKTHQAFERKLKATLRLWQSGTPHYEFILKNGIVSSPSKYLVGKHGYGRYTWWASTIDWLASMNCAVEIMDQWDNGTLAYSYDDEKRLLHPMYSHRQVIRELVLQELERCQPTDNKHTGIMSATVTLVEKGSSFYGKSDRRTYDYQFRFLRAIQNVPNADQHWGYLLDKDERDAFSEDSQEYFTKAALIPNDKISQRAQEVLEFHHTIRESPRSLSAFEQLKIALESPDPPLRRINLQAQLSGRRKEPVFPTGWLSCGNSMDLIWERHSRNALYLRNQSDELTRLFKINLHTQEGWKRQRRFRKGIPAKTYFGHGLFAPCFDGKYIWAPIVGPTPLVLVINPKTQQVWKLTEKDGLPPMNRGGAAVALGVGKVCLIGSFDTESQPLRAWFAMATFGDHAEEGAASQIEVFHEAPETSDSERPAQDRWTHAGLAFSPGTSILTANPTNPTERRILVIRHYPAVWRNYDFPILLNPDARQFKNTWQHGNGTAWCGVSHACTFQNSFYWMSMSHYVSNPRLIRCSWPDFKAVEVAVDLPRISYLVPLGEYLYGVDITGKAWKIDPNTGAFSQLDIGIPGIPGSRFVRSANYGLVLLVPFEPNPFLNEAYVVTSMLPPNLKPEDFSPVKLIQPKRRHYHRIRQGMTGLQVATILGRAAYADGGDDWGNWYYGREAKESTQVNPEFDFQVHLRAGTVHCVDWHNE